MGRKLRTPEIGIFPVKPEQRFAERNRVVARAMAVRAGLPDPEKRPAELANLGDRNLPAWRKKSEIQNMIRDNQLSMLEGPTGSGKSSQLSQYALEMGYRVIYFEPRILTADSVADRLIYELDQQLGIGGGKSLVGVRHSDRSEGHGNAAQFMTPDTALRIWSEIEQYADEPVLFVADEIHEKNFPMELAFAKVGSALESHPKWRMCAVSATLESEPIRRVGERQLGRPVPLTSIEGRPHAYEWIDEPELTTTEAYEKYRSAHTKAQLFTAGKEEIGDITDKIEAKKYPKTRVTPLHAKQTRLKNRQATNAQLLPGEKQVIPSTNAGTSGITIPGQTLVVSDGTVRRQDLDPDGVTGLFKRECSQDELIQQAGRAGRDVEGGLFVLARPGEDSGFEFKPLHERDEHAPAEIYHTNIAQNVLAITALGDNFYDLNKWLPNDVDTKRIIEAYEVLYRLGAIDEKNQITEIGERMNRLPLRPEFSRAIVAAQIGKASPDQLRRLIAMVSAINEGGLPYFEHGISTNWRDDIRGVTKDDYAAQLDMFIATRSYRDDEKKLEEHNYDVKQTPKAHKTFDKICKRLGIENDTPLYPEADDVGRLYEYLATGLFDFAHEKTEVAGSQRPHYVSIFGTTGDTPRALSDRGTYNGGDNLVIGLPRRFEKRVKGEPKEQSTIEHVIPTTPEILAKAALWLAERVPSEQKIVGGQLVSQSDVMLGAVRLGSETTKQGIMHTAETRRLLREAAFAKPTQALSELIEIKKELEGLVRLTPPEKLDEYFPDGIMTDDWLVEKINHAIDGSVDNIFMLDNNLRRMIIDGQIDLATWVKPDVAAAIVDAAPEYISLANGQQYNLYYTHGQPVINGFNLRDADALPDELLLPDGREVLINFTIPPKIMLVNGTEIYSPYVSDTKMHTAAAIKEYADSLE